MQYIVLDLEATCWERGRKGQMEIIEIGAVRMLDPAAEPTDEFASFVRPIASPTLSDFCTELTSIRQEDVDAADPFPVVLERFLEWTGSPPLTLCSWGKYDLNQLRKDCARHRIRVPEWFPRHVNLKATYAEQRGLVPSGMAGALRREGIPLEGRHHRGIDDARNIAKLARLVLPRLSSDS